MNIFQAFLLFVCLPIGVVFAVLLKLSSMPRFAQSRAYILPIVCGIMLTGWALWSTYYFVRDDRLDPFGLSRFGGLLGLVSFIWGLLVGGLLYFSSTLWTGGNRFPGLIMYLFCIFLEAVAVPVVFFLIMSQSDWSR